jgi:hypothetical protein
MQVIFPSNKITSNFKVVITLFKKKIQIKYRSLVDSVVIGVEFDKKNYGSMSHKYNYERAETALC